MVIQEQTLVISHIIYLTPEERTALVKKRKPAQIVGISVPVWFHQGKSSEPAHEVLCQYMLTNEPQDMMITSLPTGYRINLPQVKPDQSEEETTKTDFHKIGNPEDGGSGWLIFKQFQTVKPQDRTFQILHYVELRDWEYYWDSVPKINDGLGI